MKDQEIQDFLQECDEVYNDILQSVRRVHEALRTPQGEFLIKCMGLSTVILLGDNEDIYEKKGKGILAYVNGSRRNISALVDFITEQRDAGKLPSVEMPEIRLDGDKVIVEENKDEADV